MLEGLQISSVTENPSVLPLQAHKHQMVELFQCCQLKYPFLAWEMFKMGSSETEMRGLRFHLLDAKTPTTCIAPCW